MNYGCLSCGAKYSIPDTRVQKAGVDGLRVRCSRCRAIMAVSSSMVKSHRAESGAGDVFSRTGGVSPHAPSTALVTGVMNNPFAAQALPSSFQASAGSLDDGHSRDVTGIVMPMLSQANSAEATTRSRDVLYAAIEGRARGPFTVNEMLMLAEKGKVRAGTLMWKPGASGWKPLKHVVEFEVSFLLDAVRTRKRREREAAMLAERRLGISPVRLERQTVRPLSRSPSSASSGRSQPPGLPFDAFFDDADAGNQFATVASAISEPSMWRASPAAPSPKKATRVRPAFAVFALVVLVAVVTVAVLAPAAVTLPTWLAPLAPISSWPFSVSL